MLDDIFPSRTQRKLLRLFVNFPGCPHFRGVLQHTLAWPGPCSMLHSRPKLLPVTSQALLCPTEKKTLCVLLPAFAGMCSSLCFTTPQLSPVSFIHTALKHSRDAACSLHRCGITEVNLGRELDQGSLWCASLNLQYQYRLLHRLNLFNRLYLLCPGIGLNCMSACKVASIA